jgi:hypothetical protein
MSTIGSPQSTVPPTAPAVVREKPGGESMRAIILERFGGLDSLVYTDIPKPLPRDGEVVIEVKGFGINRSYHDAVTSTSLQINTIWSSRSIANPTFSPPDWRGAAL